MKQETEQEQIDSLQRDVALLKSANQKLTAKLDIYAENFRINIQNLADKTGNPVLRKRPCDKCEGKGQIITQKWVDPKASKDCTPGAPTNIESKPCLECDSIGIIWK
jgi:hypothetical protein